MLLWDGYGLQSTHSGIGRHALELAEGLTTLRTAPRILPSVPRLDRAFIKWETDRAPFKAGRIKPLSLWAAGRQACSVASGSGPHIFHGLSNYNIPLLPKSFQKVLTVHDLIPFLAPDAVSRSLRIYMHFQLPRALRYADRIICVSRWSADCLASLYPATKAKTIVIMNGRPDWVFKAKGQSGRIRLLSVSRSEGYKRLMLIPSVLKALPEDFEWHVVAQGKGLEDLKSVPRLRLHTGLSDAALASLWDKTDVFVHPSLWEGYCLPAATALSRGIPTVYTGGSGIDEVLGQAGVRLSASEASEAWAHAIQESAQSLNLWPERCKAQWGILPSWGEVARQTQGVYATLLG